ncbi:MAG: glycosyltransferase, partial [Planctomycetota bacterium]
MSDVTVGFVAIGRNEGERALTCVRSALRDAADASAVVYVDSGSTDGSPEKIAALGVTVVDLDTSQGFTAARARNAGLAELKRRHPGCVYVQFLDGDCELVEGWIATAVAALEADAKLAGVCGRRRERHPEATVYNKLCDMEWDTPVGPADAVGGDALFRIAALDEVDAYDPTMIAGEEPEMCIRLRAKGWTLARLGAEMTLHDAAMTSWRQWWNRNKRAGHAYAETLDRHPPIGKKEVRSNDAFGIATLAFPICTV